MGAAWVVCLAVLGLSQVFCRATPVIAQEIKNTTRAVLVPDSLPSNITATFKGNWKTIVGNAELNRSRFLQGSQGDVMFEIRTGPNDTFGVSRVQGEVLLRDGNHVTDMDVRFKVEGFYVRDSGRLYAVLQPARSLKVKLTKKEIKEGGPDYRSALRLSARQWSQMPPPLLVYGIPIEEQIELMKQCSFMLHLNVSLQEEGDQRDGKAGRGEEGRESFKPDVKLDGFINSDNCDLSLAVSSSAVHIEVYYAKAIHYTLATTVITFIQILLLIKQIEATSTPSTAMRVSLLTVCQQTTIDAYLCLLHLTAGIVMDPLFNAFAMVSFFEFVLFAIFEMRYMLLVWRAQRGNSLDPGDTRRELSILYTRFYGVLLFGVLLAYQLQGLMHILVFAFYSFWIPQIVHCIRKDLRQPLRPLYIIGMTITRALLPVYVYGCPKNLLRVSPAPGVWITLCIYVAVQVVVLLFQYYYGPTCFVPKRFLPDRHDYFRPLTEEESEHLFGSPRRADEETGQGVVECVICMSPLEIRRPRSRMVAPCGHFFHPHCLQRWMDIKMECPTCRHPLPPL